MSARDQVDADYRGEEKAGIRSLLIMRERPRKEVKGTRAISRLSEIFNLIWGYGADQA